MNTVEKVNSRKVKTCAESELEFVFGVFKSASLVYGIKHGRFKRSHQSGLSLSADLYSAFHESLVWCKPVSTF